MKEMLFFLSLLFLYWSFSIDAIYKKKLKLLLLFYILSCDCPNKYNNFCQTETLHFFAFLDVAERLTVFFIAENYFITIYFPLFFVPVLKSTCDQLCTEEITKIQEIKSLNLNWSAIISLPT